MPLSLGGISQELLPRPGKVKQIWQGCNDKRDILLRAAAELS